MRVAPSKRATSFVKLKLIRPSLPLKQLVSKDILPRLSLQTELRISLLAKMFASLLKMKKILLLLKTGLLIRQLLLLLHQQQLHLHLLQPRLLQVEKSK